jgi:hypothetical protein
MTKKLHSTTFFQSATFITYNLPSLRMLILLYINIIVFSVNEFKNYKFPFGLYWCKNSSPTLREERRLSELEKRVLRRIFGTKRDEIIGVWRKPHNEELDKSYSL